MGWLSWCWGEMWKWIERPKIRNLNRKVIKKNAPDKCRKHRINVEAQTEITLQSIRLLDLLHFYHIRNGIRSIHRTHVSTRAAYAPAPTHSATAIAIEKVPSERNQINCLILPKTRVRASRAHRMKTKELKKFQTTRERERKKMKKKKKTTNKTNCLTNGHSTSFKSSPFDFMSDSSSSSCFRFLILFRFFSYEFSQRNAISSTYAFHRFIIWFNRCVEASLHFTPWN